MECGHEEVASLLRRAAAPAEASPAAAPSSSAAAHLAQCEALRHEDGLGILEEPPEDIIFAGLRESEPLRRAVNMIAGYNITPPLPVTRSLQAGGAETADRVADVVRGCLQATEFALEDVGEGEVALPADDEEESSTLRFCGLLLFEPPGAVSPDAPGHWVALRRHRRRDHGAGLVAGRPSVAATGAAKDAEYWRLDPVRGPFRLEASELTPLLGRYRAWRMVQGPSHLREERAAKLARAGEEAEAILRRKATPTAAAAAAAA